MQNARCLRMLCFGCLILFLYHPRALYAQSYPKDVAGLIQSSIETKTGTWSRETPLSVAVKMKNISNGPVDLLGIYSFQLIRVDDPPMVYWSPINILDGTPLRLEGGKVPKGAIHLEPHEIKQIDLDVTKLLWDRTISSVWPNQRLFDVVLKGNYDLILDVETVRRTNSENNPIVAHIASNKVRIVVR